MLGATGEHRLFAQPPTVRPAQDEIGRYQLVVGEYHTILGSRDNIPDTRRQAITLKIDTATGKVWRFVDAFVVGDNDVHTTLGFLELPEGQSASNSNAKRQNLKAVRLIRMAIVYRPTVTKPMPKEARDFIHEDDRRG
jgi:hypothetical protein